MQLVGAPGLCRALVLTRQFACPSCPAPLTLAPVLFLEQRTSSWALHMLFSCVIDAVSIPGRKRGPKVQW